MEASNSESLNISTRDRVCRKLERDLGNLLLSVLRDSNTVEIMVNADGRIW